MRCSVTAQVTLGHECTGDRPVRAINDLHPGDRHVDDESCVRPGRNPGAVTNRAGCRPEPQSRNPAAVPTGFSTMPSSTSDSISVSLKPPDINTSR